MIFAVLLGVLVVLICVLNNYLLTYWSRLRIKQIKGSFLFGNAWPLVALKVSLGEFFKNIYNDHKEEKCVGVYVSYKPMLVITDPVLVQNILIKDFDNFKNRPMPIDEVNDPISGHLFALRGKKWAKVREKLSPAFTPRRIKVMFPIIRRCAKVLESYLSRKIKEGVDVFEFRELSARYNTNVISSVAFGIDNDCINEPDNIFRRMSEGFFEPNFKNFAKEALTFLGGPKLFHTLKLRIVDRNVESFLFAIFKQTVDYREANNFIRNDFMHLLIQLKNNGFISTSNEDDHKKDNFTLNMNEITAQAALFFLAGYETTNQALLFCLYEIVKNPGVQEKIHSEIDNAMFWSDDKVLNYEMVEQMKYLDCCIEETLRKYPVVPVIVRIASKDYQVSEHITIPKGTSVVIPSLGFHRDPEIYENPMHFKPERFMCSTNGSGRSKGIFHLSFGSGPRNCNAAKLGKTFIKIFLATIILKFRLEFKDPQKCEEKLKLHPNQVILTSLSKNNFRLHPR